MIDQDLRGLRQIIDSLRKFNDSRLSDEKGKNVIADLYVDLKGGNVVLHELLADRTSFLIGRKGTGKSTLFQRMMFEIESDPSRVYSYIDMKVVVQEAEDLTQSASAELTEHERERLFQVTMQISFLRALVDGLKESIEKKSSRIEKLKAILGASKNKSLTDKLAQLVLDAEHQQYVDVDLRKTERVREFELSQKENGASGGVVVSNDRAGVNVSLDSSALHQQATERELGGSNKVRFFSLTKFVDEVKGVLATGNFNSMFVLVDDFSELRASSIEAVISGIIEPLYNVADNFIKFKISCYPGRFSTGQIDITKIDQVHVDLFSTYSSSNIGHMETSAQRFIYSLLNARAEHFKVSSLEALFEGEIDAIVQQLFFASMGNPRQLGRVLDEALKVHLSAGRNKPRITSADIRDGAENLSSSLQSAIANQRFADRSIDERTQSVHTVDLLTEILDKAKRESSKPINATSYGFDPKGKKPASHFFIASELDTYMVDLELGHLATKYQEVKSRDNISVSVYALNYGLCHRNYIPYGRVRGDEVLPAKYFTERWADPSF